MALNDETIRYIPGAVNGTAAYDLSRLERFDYGTAAPDLEDGAETTEPQREEPSSRRSGGAHTAPRAAFRIRPLSVVGVLCVAFLAVLALLANLRLTAITAETVELEHRLSQLQEEQGVLRIQYENTFRLTEMEEYAVRTLGMVRLQESQIVILEQTAEDKAEILREDENEAARTVLQEAGSLWPAIKAYFVR